jgi:hypothetical protein
LTRLQGEITDGDMKDKLPLRVALGCAIAVGGGLNMKAEETPMLGGDLAIFFDRSIEPGPELYDETFGGSALVTGGGNPLGDGAALRFTDQSAFIAPRLIGLLEPAITTQFRISLKAYNNVYVEGGTRGARLRFGVNEVGLITTESRVAATITFKQNNTIQAKGDLPDDPGALLVQPIELQTPYAVDIIVNVHRTESYTYPYRGMSMTLNPESYHVMVDGTLLPGMPATGLGLALAAGGEYAGWRESFGGAVDLIGFVSATGDTGVDWYFSDMILATGDDIPMGGGSPAQWGGYDIIQNDHVYAGATMGYLYIREAPYVYSYKLGRWVYINENAINDSGLWMFVW